MPSSDHLPRRLVALVTSIFICLASGTPYLYGVFAPQLVSRVGLTISDSATISLASNLGSGVGGLPGGLMIDHFGPQISILVGSICIFVGYFGVFKIYEHQWGNLFVICISMMLMGFGSITSYFATLKAAQANFPKHRGAAGAFPVSSYGLSATLFSVIAATFYRDNTGGLLEFLALFCGAIAFVGSFFIHIYLEHEDEDDNALEAQKSLTEEETALISMPEAPSSSAGPEEIPQPVTAARMERSDSLPGSFRFWGLGTRTPGSSISSTAEDMQPFLQNIRDQNKTEQPQNNNNPFLSRQDSTASLATNATATATAASKVQALRNKASSTTVTSKSPPKSKSPFTIIKDRLTDRIFLTHYFIVSIISGMGQTYIYTVGFIVTAQYYYNKDQVQENSDLKINLRGIAGVHAKIATSAAALQALQVSIISLASFSGRLFSGFMSDFLHKKFHIQRLWIVVVTVIILSVGQFITITNVNSAHLISVSSAIIGGSYGLVFGTYPAVVADSFGTRTFSTNWGLICTGPLITLFFLNKYFGVIYDSQTDPTTGICYRGNECYKGAFEFSFGLCFIVFFTTLVIIYVQRKK